MRIGEAIHMGTRPNSLFFPEQPNSNLFLSYITLSSTFRFFISSSIFSVFWREQIFSLIKKQPSIHVCTQHIFIFLQISEFCRDNIPLWSNIKFSNYRNGIEEEKFYGVDFKRFTGEQMLLWWIWSLIGRK